MSFWRWSTTAANNDIADPSVNMREGWAPSIVNNSGRALMAALAKGRNDWCGNIETTGTLTDYAITSNQGLANLVDGFRIAARIHVTNGEDATLSVDSLSAKPIQETYGSAIPAGALQAGSIYTFVYNSSADAWIVHGRFGDTMTSTANPDLAAIEALTGNGVARRTDDNAWALDDLATAIIFVKDRSGVVLQTGILGDCLVPFDCEIVAATLLADQTGSAVVDIWKDSYANYPPTAADSITASAKPAITSATKSQDVSLPGWTTAISAGDTLRFNLDSVTAITRLTIILHVKRYG